MNGLPAASARLRDVVILDAKEATNVITKQDGPKTLFYLDPPYLHSTRVTTGDYECEMTAEQHRRLLEVLTGIEGKFILSGYRSDLYDRYADKYGWHREDIEIDNKASSAKTKEKKVECLWMNYDLGQRVEDDDLTEIGSFIPDVAIQESAL